MSLMALVERLEHLRSSYLGFGNLTHYITRALLETSGFKPQLHPQLQKPHLCTFAPTAGSPTICGWSLNRTYVHLECASL